jgi:alkaline phosphatase
MTTREDDMRDVIAAFRARGHQVVRSTAELAAASGAKVLGLFADDDMDFEIAIRPEGRRRPR